MFGCKQTAPEEKKASPQDIIQKQLNDYNLWLSKNQNADQKAFNAYRDTTIDEIKKQLEKINNLREAYELKGTQIRGDLLYFFARFYFYEILPNWLRRMHELSDIPLSELNHELMGRFAELSRMLNEYQYQHPHVKITQQQLDKMKQNLESEAKHSQKLFHRDLTSPGSLSLSAPSRRFVTVKGVQI